MLEGAFEDRYKVDFVRAAAHRLKRPSERWMRGTQEGSVPAGSAEEILLPLVRFMREHTRQWSEMSNCLVCHHQ